MSYTRPRKHHQQWPAVVNPFDFTDQELWRMQRGILVSTRNVAYYRWGPSAYRKYGKDIPMQRYNQRVSRNMLRAVRTGVPTKNVPERVLKQVYESAHAAYGNAKRFQCDEATARRRAVTTAQTAMEFAIGIFRSGEFAHRHQCSDCGGPA